MKTILIFGLWLITACSSNHKIQNKTLTEAQARAILEIEESMTMVDTDTLRQ